MVAWSSYFKSYIKVMSYVDDTHWTFSLCDEKGNLKSRRVMPANSKYTVFKWKPIEP